MFFVYSQTQFQNINQILIIQNCPCPTISPALIWGNTIIKFYIAYSLGNWLFNTRNFFLFEPVVPEVSAFKQTTETDDTPQ